MKKFISLLLFIFVSLLPVFAADWKEICPKKYVDVTSITWDKNVVSFWIKSLNPGDWKLINNKKVWYTNEFFLLNCKKKKMDLQSVIFYDLQGKTIDILELDEVFVQWHNVVPETTSDLFYRAFCR